MPHGVLRGIERPRVARRGSIHVRFHLRLDYVAFGRALGALGATGTWAETSQLVKASEMST